MLAKKIKKILEQYSKIQTSSFIGEIDNLKYKVENYQDGFNVAIIKANLEYDFYFNKKAKTFEFEIFLDSKFTSPENSSQYLDNTIKNDLIKILKEYKQNENKNSKKTKNQILIMEYGGKLEDARIYEFVEKKRHTAYLKWLDGWQKKSDEQDFTFKESI